MSLPTYPEVAEVLSKQGRTVPGLKATVAWAEQAFTENKLDSCALQQLSDAALENLQEALPCDTPFSTARNNFLAAFAALQAPETSFERGRALAQAKTSASHLESAIKVFRKSEKTLPDELARMLDSFDSAMKTLDNVSFGVKACVKVALQAAVHTTDDLLSITSADIFDLLCLMPCMASQVPAGLVADWYRAQAPKLARMALNVGNFSSKLSDTSTSVALRASPERSQGLAALSSASVVTPTRVGFFGSASDFTDSLFFCGAFLFDNKLTTLIELAVTKHPAIATAIARLGLPADIFDEIVQNYTGNTAAPTDRVPQVLWPVGDTYHGLSPLPSVAVLNALAGRTSRGTHPLHSPGTFLPVEQNFSIGGANPQNVGPFNQAHGGKYPLFKVAIPRFSTDPAKKLIRAAMTRDWLCLPKKSDALIQELESDWIARPFEQRQKAARRLARAMAHVALHFADALRELQNEMPEAFDAAFWEKHRSNPAVKYVRKDDPLDFIDELASAVLNKFAWSARSLETSLDKQTLLLDALKVALKEHTA